MGASGCVGYITKVLTFCSQVFILNLKKRSVDNMKKIVFILTLILCLSTCLSIFTACDDGPITALLVGETAESAEDFIEIGEYTYGNDGAIISDIKKLKFFGVDENGKKREIKFSKLTAVYEDENGDTYTKKPSKLTVGTWSIKYGYKDRNCEVAFYIEQSASGKFTAKLKSTSWTYGEDMSLIELRNPEGKIVAPTTDSSLSPDDTNIRIGSLDYLGFKKDFYNTLGDEKYNAESLWTIYFDAQTGRYQDNVICGYDVSMSYKYRPGDYVLVIFDMLGTHNYSNVVCTVEFTVKAA